MLEDRIVYMNGDFIAWNRANVHMMSHSFGRGSAIFEVLSFHETIDGPMIFRLDAHVRRLFKSAKLLGMALDTTMGDLQGAVQKTVKQNGLMNGFIKVICFYPQIVFEILPPQNHVDIAIFVLDPDQDLGGVDFSFEPGTTVCVSKWRKLDPQTVPIEAKAAANYLNGMMARLEAKERRFEKVLMLDTQGFIAEGGTESVFLVQNNRLLAPSLGTILESITRKSILEAAAWSGIEIIERRLHPELLFQADEIFLSATPYQVLPVRQIENHQITSSPGPITRKMHELMRHIIYGREKRFRNWLFPAN